MTTFVVAPTRSGIFTALRSFLLSVLPSGIAVVQGQDNRVAEPAGSDFLVMQQPRFERLETNTDSYADCFITASITANVMTVTEVKFGIIVLGNQVFGSGVTANTVIQSQTSGPTGGTGTYLVSQSQTVGSESMACGTEALLQPTKVTIQLDVHGPNGADNAQVISTMFRDDYAVRFFAALPYDLAPILCDDPKQIPFIDGEQQYEDRYVVDAVLQANQVVQIPMQFAGAVDLGLISVDATYPA